MRKLLIVVLLTVYANAKNKSLDRLSVGDIVNINNLNYESTEIGGDIFNGFDGGRFIETENYENIFNMQCHTDICLELNHFTEKFFFPKFYIDNNKLDMQTIIKNHSKKKYFDDYIDPRYVTSEYKFSIVEICLRDNEKHLMMKLFDTNDFSTINENAKPSIIYNKTGILKYQKNNETHYVSSIFTGECLYQIIVHNAKTCDELSQNDRLHVDKNSFLESGIYKSKIITASGNNSVVDEINNHDQQFSLIINCKSDFEAQKKLFNSISKNIVIRIDLQTLPKLPDLPTQNLGTNIVSLEISKPGNIINIDTKNVYHLFNSDGKIHDYNISPSMFQEYTNCYENVHEALTSELSDSKEPNKPQYLYKLSLFHKKIKSFNYGVDREYLNDNYKCLKTTVCSGFAVQISDMPDFKIVNLDEFSGDGKYNIFENENIVMIYGKNSTSYHVRRIESGDCLFQALIYPALTSISQDNHLHVSPVQMGRIMSASGDKILENRVKIFLDSDPLNTSESLFTVINMLNSNKVMINLYLNKIDY